MKIILQKTAVILFLISPFLQSCGSGKNQDEEDKSKIETISIADQKATNDMVQRYNEEQDNKVEEIVYTKIDRSHLSEIEQNYYAALDAIDSAKTLLQSMDFRISYGIKTVTSNSSSDYGRSDRTWYFDDNNNLMAYQSDEWGGDGPDSTFYWFKDSLANIHYRSYLEMNSVYIVVFSSSNSKFIQRIPLLDLEEEIKEEELSYLIEWNPGEKLFTGELGLLEMYLLGHSMSDYKERDGGYYHYVESENGEESYEISDLIISKELLVPLLQIFMKPRFSVNSKLGTVVTNFQFDASKSTTSKNQDSALKFRWDFENDGSWDTDYLSSSVTSHTYETTGIKRVKLEITDNEGLKSSIVNDIEVLEVQALFTSNLVVGDVSTTFEFDASTSSAKNSSDLRFRWDFDGDGMWDTEFTTDKKIKHQYKNEGIMPLILEVKNSEGNTNVKSSQLVVFKFDSLTDIDGNIYKVAKIGKKWWMMDNLKVKHYNNGDNIKTGLDAKTWKKTRNGAFASYDNDSANIAKYGLLYNYYTIENKNAIAPEGWHVATDDEWQELGSYLEELDLINKSNMYTSKKSLAYKIGFLEVLGGRLNVEYGDFQFDELNDKSNFWSSTSYDNKRVWYNSLDYRGFIKKGYGFSIRCVKD